MAALICGSLAYDTVMVFPGRFKDHILPDKIHMLNVAFLAPTLRRYFGGCAGNIAYNLKLLDAEGYACGAVGHDFDPYAKWMDATGMSMRHVRVIDDEYTAQAYITTDLDDNQITAFHPGAMNHSHSVAVPADGSISIGILAPDGRDGMLTHAEQFARAGIPFIFDPGQAMPLFGPQDFENFIDLASWVTVNDYEGQLLQERVGLSAERIAERVKAYIVTRGAEGSLVYCDGRMIEIPAVRPDSVQDPTGCGDAYRAGLLLGLMRGMDWETTGRIASLMGAIKIAHVGTQHHSYSLQEFGDRFHAAFGYRFD
ncbi:MAG: carbohydrate kinase family protein [Gammaproteobacteria bacterium]|jgi:adenosine kinase|nr:carbohydrate kinase family protein [Gammaproteobacteria bacterium]